MELLLTVVECFLGHCCPERSENEASLGGVLWRGVYCNGCGPLPCQLPSWQKQKFTVSSELVSFQGLL